MAIRFEAPSLAGIVGAYGAGDARRRATSRKYQLGALLQQQRHAQRMAMLGARGGRRAAARPAIGGMMIDPLADPDAFSPLAEATAAEGARLQSRFPDADPAVLAERARDLAMRRLRRQQRAQMRTAGRKYRLGEMPTETSLLPRYLSPDAIERARGLAREDFEWRRDRAAEVEDRDLRSGAATLKEMRSAVAGEVAGLEIPEGAMPDDRADLMKLRADLKEFTRLDIDLSDPDVQQTYRDAIEDFYNKRDAILRKDPLEAERENTFWRSATTGEVLDGPGPGAIPYDRRTGKPLDLPEDPAAIAAAKEAAKAEKAAEDRWNSIVREARKLVGTKDINGEPIPWEKAVSTAIAREDYLDSLRARGATLGPGAQETPAEPPTPATEIPAATPEATPATPQLGEGASVASEAVAAPEVEQAENPWLEAAEPARQLPPPNFSKLLEGADEESQREVQQLRVLYGTSNDQEVRNAIAIILSKDTSKEELLRAIATLANKGIDIEEVLAPPQQPGIDYSFDLGAAGSM